MQHSNTRYLLYLIYKSLGSRRKKQLLFLLLVMLLAGIAELVSLSLVVPFLGIISNPDYFYEHSLSSYFSWFLQVRGSNDLLFKATTLFVVSIVVSAFIRLQNLYLGGRLAAAIGSDLSIEAYRRTIYQPYRIHLDKNSSDVINNITSQISITVSALSAFLQLVSSVIIAMFLVGAFLFINYIIALLTLFVFGGTYTFLAFLVRKKLRRNGLYLSHARKVQIQSIQEGLGAIRDVILGSTQPLYIKNYSNADIPMRRLTAENIFIGSSPRYVFEALGMIFIAVLGYAFTLFSDNNVSLIPVLGTIALGAQRLLPSLQQIYRSWSHIKSSHASMLAIVTMIHQQIQPKCSVATPVAKCPDIMLKDIYFKYTSESDYILRELDLTINAGDRIGIVGSTGSGKSTLVDLIIGLLEPSSGQILLDGRNLYDADGQYLLNSWRASIANVPQHIFLSDSSIAENIAFGVPSHLINTELLRFVSRIAHISDFIESTFEGYSARVGERGVKLSGGQRQRLGIARALYRNPQILVLDEATSALDIKTEFNIINSIQSLDKNLTIIMIAHRLSTLKHCNKVYEVRDGHLFQVPIPS